MLESNAAPAAGRAFPFVDPTLLQASLPHTTVWDRRAATPGMAAFVTDFIHPQHLGVNILSL